MGFDAEMTTTLVYGLAVAGRAVASELVSRGEKVILVDDLEKCPHHAGPRLARSRWSHYPRCRVPLVAHH